MRKWHEDINEDMQRVSRISSVGRLITHPGASRRPNVPGSPIRRHSAASDLGRNSSDAAIKTANNAQPGAQKYFGFNFFKKRKRTTISSTRSDALIQNNLSRRFFSSVLWAQRFFPIRKRCFLSHAVRTQLVDRPKAESCSIILGGGIRKPLPNCPKLIDVPQTALLKSEAFDPI